MIKPLRIGARKDRRYRPGDLEKIMSDRSIVKELGLPATEDGKMDLTQLKQFLWKSADILRGNIDSADYKKYIFGLLFFKRISDVWDEEYNKMLKKYGSEEIAKANYNHRFQVPKECRWEVVQKQARNIGQKLNKVFDKITTENSPKLDNIFDGIDFANTNMFPNETLQKLISHFSEYNFGNTYIQF